MFNEIETDQIYVAEMQGNVFEMSADYNLDSEIFIDTFMNSQAAMKLDKRIDKLQWCGKMHLWEVLMGQNDFPKGNVWDIDALFWIGYTYRYWHYLTGQTSKEIYSIANAELMAKVYCGLHTMSTEQAVERILSKHACPHQIEYGQALSLN